MVLPDDPARRLGLRLGVREHPGRPAGGRRAQEAADPSRLGHGNVYFGTDDNYVVAVDVETGEEVVAHAGGGPRSSGRLLHAARAPLLVNDIVRGRLARGEPGDRGHIVAFDATTPASSAGGSTSFQAREPGNETWAGRQLALRRHAAWMTGSYDPELDLIYWGTGNASSDFYGGHRLAPTCTRTASSRGAARHRRAGMVLPDDPARRLGLRLAYENILVDLPVDGEPQEAADPSRQERLRLRAGPHRRGVHRGLEVRGHTDVDHRIDAAGVPQGRLEPKLDYRPSSARTCSAAGAGTRRPSARRRVALQHRHRVVRRVPGARGTRWSRATAGWAARASCCRCRPGKWSRTSTPSTRSPGSGSGSRHEAPRAGGAALHRRRAGVHGDPEGNFFALDRTRRGAVELPDRLRPRGGPISYSVDGKQYIATPSGPWGSSLGSMLGEPLQLTSELQGARQGATMIRLRSFI